LSKNPSVYAVYDVTGDSDVLIFTRFRSRDELSKFVKSVLGNPYVLRTNTRLILTTIKRSLEIPFSNDSEKKARKASS
jgi:Lrp/AsnC family transcriptional regulator for asnA, asnC and gidA